MPKPVTIVFCGYNREHIDRSFPFLLNLKEILPESQMIAVMNADGHSSGLENSSKLIFDKIIYNHNYHYEFGAYQAGLDVVDFSFCMGVIFCNDTVYRKNVQSSILLMLRSILFTLREGDSYQIGLVDQFDMNRFSVSGLTGDRWASTHFFFLSAALVSRMNRQVDFIGEFASEAGDLNGVDPGDGEQLISSFFVGVDPILRANLEKWLFHGKWYGSEPLTVKNFDFFTRKKLAILNEVYISFLAMRYGRLMCLRESLAIAKQYSELSS